MLILKDKRANEEPYDRSIETGAKVVVASETAEPAILDSAGTFKISVDREECVLVAAHYLSSDDIKPVNVIKGKTAETVYAKILEKRLLSRLDHAAYLGSELSKAEVALQTGKEYIQDKELFRK